MIGLVNTSRVAVRPIQDQALLKRVPRRVIQPTPIRPNASN